MPAAAVIPAPIAYIKFVAVKKLVVGFLLWAGGPHYVRVSVTALAFSWAGYVLDCMHSMSKAFTLRKLECSRQAYASAYISMEW